jgi:hypothetical protein
MRISDLRKRHCPGPGFPFLLRSSASAAMRYVQIIDGTRSAPACLAVHLGKPEMPHGGWTEAADSTETGLAATIQWIKDLAAAPH